MVFKVEKYGFFIAFAFKIGFLFIKAQPLRILSDVFTQVERKTINTLKNDYRLRLLKFLHAQINSYTLYFLTN